MKKFNLTTTVILEKKFTTEMSGYNPAEVDQYLDEIIEDYNAYDEIVKLQETKLIEKTEIITEKDEEIQKLTIEIQNLKEQVKHANKINSYELLEKIKELSDSKTKDE